MTTEADSARRGSTAARALTVLSALLVLAGCAGTGTRAPVEDRSSSSRPGSAPATAGAPAAAPVAATPAEPAKLPPGAENAGKPGYFTVRPGDTLIRVGLETGQNWRDIARWNGIDNPNVIEVGQVLRVVPPVADANGVVVRPVAPSGRVEARPLDAKPAPAGTAPTAAPATPPGASAPPTTPATATPAPAAAPAPVANPSAAPRDPDEDLGWAWPAAGAVMTPFDEQRSKGLAIGGKVGDPVLAAADGRVVYAGSGLRGFGNLVIVKHNNTYLSAYAHNQVLLVKEDQLVRRGQKIAEMGSSEAERVQLHFEIRRQGKPVDPARLLPPR
jgi:lipoprotein NlpD